MSTFDFSNDAASEMMTLLLDRRYLNEDATTTSPLSTLDETIDYERWKEKASSKEENVVDASSSSEYVLSIDSQNLFTRRYLQTQFASIIMNDGGRISLKQAATLLLVHESDMKNALPSPNDQSTTNCCYSSFLLDDKLVQHVVTPSRDEWFISPMYWKEQLPVIIQSLVVEKGGILSINEIAKSILDLPHDFVLNQLSDIIQHNGGDDDDPSRTWLKKQAQISTLSNGTRALITTDYIDTLKMRIRGALSATFLPTLIESLCKDIQGKDYFMNQVDDGCWDLDLTQSLVSDLCATEQLDGELLQTTGSEPEVVRGGGRSSLMYVPHCYTRQQRIVMEESFRSNSFLTAKMCRQSLGIQPSSMGKYVLESFPKATVIGTTDAVVDMDAISSPLIAIIQDVIAEESFVDLKLHVPSPLLELETVCQAIIKEIMLQIKSAEDELGQLVRAEDETLFVSANMIKNIQSKLLPPVIQTFAKERAREIIREEEKGKSDSKKTDDTNHDASAKQKHLARERRRLKKASSNTTPTDTQSLGIVPLVTVARAVQEAYPGLMELQKDEQQWADEKTASPQWQEEEDGHNSGRGPSYAFCNKVVDVDSLRENCSDAIQVELKKLYAAKKTASVISSTKDDGDNQVSFEESFPIACHQLQLYAKFVAYVKEKKLVTNQEEMEAIQRDFLLGPCASFAQLITQDCLRRNESEDVVFSFGKQSKDDSIINRACRQFSPVVLSCRDENDNTKDPLLMFRKVLPGSMGTTLGKLWKQCEDNAVQADSDESFLSFVEVNCLTICGIPFKRLDKKSEKQFLLARRQELIAALEGADDPVDVLELSVMLLYQQVRGFVVSGSLLCPLILNLLVQERKIPTQLGELMKAMGQNLQSVDDGVVEKVQECGLSRDVSKVVRTWTSEEG